MRDLLPPSVAVAVAELPDWEGALLPEEQAGLSDQAVASRRRDFTAGRVCARRAISALGRPPVAVPTAANRAPIWPTGVVGAITHTHGYCAAAAANADEVRSVGLDAEQHKRLSPGVLRMICLPEEEALLRRLPAGTFWPTVVFSAKETIYKVWHPIVGTWLDFHDAVVTLDPQAGRFTARIAPARVDAAPVDDPPAVVSGWFSVDGGLVRTAAVLLPA
ncbi:4'-phosphopantetheinyl transferase superfamily protein [Salinispora arenicola]|uniref:4'-phosphopantetheinyl transferase family protein n=1 Tax=Salinispora arenicola TaxID=168697 RepID=UPI000378C6B9|nr:4'-phosphopantetheinyl transferase superfamily protein [Salinispora arenicola]NIL42046.1 4'-phosphopantetheinyl transferase superfamily protein [Salinispora arenicola]